MDFEAEKAEAERQRSLKKRYDRYDEDAAGDGSTSPEDSNAPKRAATFVMEDSSFIKRANYFTITCINVSCTRKALESIYA